MDPFGIFREDSAPVVSARNIPGSVPSNIKAKGRVLGIKKKALGDVSNTVSQKSSAKSNEAGEKGSNTCCSEAQLKSTSCQPAEKVKELALTSLTKDESDMSPICKHCHEDFDYDIVPKCERLSENALKQLTNFWTPNSSSPMSRSDLDLDLLSVDFNMTYPFMQMHREFSPSTCTVPFFD